jgi:DNA-binding XRE family transcriptional regulator
MAIILDRTVLPDIIEAQKRLGLNQEALGKLVGVSRKTVSRWFGGGSDPSPQAALTMIRALHPAHRDVAARLAKHLSTTLDALGLPAPAPPPKAASLPLPPPLASPPPRPFPPAHLVVESVVCAAADAQGLAPSAVRPLVQAAFARARGLGVTIAEVDDALSGKAEAKEGKAAKKKE